MVGVGVGVLELSEILAEAGVRSDISTVLYCIEHGGVSSLQFKLCELVTVPIPLVYLPLSPDGDTAGKTRHAHGHRFHGIDRRSNQRMAVWSMG